MMRESQQQAIGRELGQSIRTCESVSGGDINDAFALTLLDGSKVFVKTQRRAPKGLFEAEARGLELLRAATPLVVPDVYAVGDGHGDAGAYLALQWLEPGTRRRDFDEQLGQGLAAQHRASELPGEREIVFGLSHDGYIGTLPQQNTPCDNWGTFYVLERLEPMLRRAVDSGLMQQSLQRAFADLFRRMDALVPNDVAPALLHGDLWAGNLHCTEDGAPALIDPAVYFGHREVDLAMMRLFGGFSRRVFDAYDEAYPLAHGSEDRVPLYQLYPLMVHVNLFGGGYVSQVAAALTQLA